MSLLALLFTHLLLLANPALTQELEETDMDEAQASAESSLEKELSPVQIGNEKTFGLGILAGDPNGLSGKLYLGGRSHAVDMALAYRLWGAFGSSYYAHGTYLVHPNEFVELDGVVLSWHTGVGPFLNFTFVDDLYAGTTTYVFGGARVPIGLDVDLEKIPLQMFIDVALNVLLIPSTQLDAQGTLGFRYYIK